MGRRQRSIDWSQTLNARTSCGRRNIISRTRTNSSITLSVRASWVASRLSPIALAVLRLMRSGGLIDCLGHACFDCLSSLTRYLLSECEELLILRRHDRRPSQHRERVHAQAMAVRVRDRRGNQRTRSCQSQVRWWQSSLYSTSENSMIPFIHRIIDRLIRKPEQPTVPLYDLPPYDPNEQPRVEATPRRKDWNLGK
jgi:hypothetical protein